MDQGCQPEMASGWRIPDPFWEGFESLLPFTGPKPQGGRPRVPDRQCMDILLYVLRIRCQWKALSR